MGKLFGTDGVRGIANQHPMTIDLAMKIGCSTAHVFKSQHQRPKIVIGKDTRLSGYMIENAIASGICSMGVDVLLVGPLPTPGIAFIANSMRADAGIVISASHNPYEYNGIKIFSGDGFKLPDETEERIEQLILSGDLDTLARPAPTEIGRARRIDDAQGRYIVFLKSTFPRDLTLEGLKIVIDCAHWAAYRVAPAVFEELGAEVIVTGNEPNGKNINDSCGSLHPDHMAMLVRAYHANLGCALDGDADRVIFADEKGEILDGDQLMAICAGHLLKHDRLKNKTLVATVMSNMGLEVAMRNFGGKLIRTAVGDRYVVEQMCQGCFNFGGEQSGHLIFLDFNTTGDGILSALQVAAVMLREGRPLSELKRIMQRYPQKMVNVKITQRKPVEELPEVMELKARFEKQLGEEGRILIRPSGTEPVVRVMVEGMDPVLIDQIVNELAQAIGKHLA